MFSSLEITHPSVLCRNLPCPGLTATCLCFDALPAHTLVRSSASFSGSYDPSETFCEQVITCAEFHPHHCNILAYSSSKGCIRLVDMRGSALCDKSAKAYEETDVQVGLTKRLSTWV